MNKKILKESFWSTFSAAVVLLLATAAHAGAYLHWESSAFLLNYTMDRPFLEIIFDPDRNDWGFYQCRELSYVLDYFDAHLVLFLLKNKIIWFISPVCIILILFCIWIQQYAGRRLFPRLPGIFFTMHALALALLPSFTETLFYRSSKLLTAAGLSVVIFGTALRFIRNSGFWGRTSTIAVAALITVLADRQGVFFITAFTGIMAVWQYFHSSRQLKDVLRAAAAAVITGVAANVLAVPLIIKVTNGYFPDFSYQVDFRHDPAVFPDALQFMLGNTGHCFCGEILPDNAVVQGVILLVCMLFLLYRHRYISPLLLCGSAAAVTLCSFLMISRHNAIMDSNVIFSGYFVPSMVIFTFFLFAAFDRLPERVRKFIFLVPAAVIYLRLTPYIKPEYLFKDDRYQKVYQDATHRLRYAIENPDCNYRTLILPYRMERLLEKLGSGTR